MTPKDESAVPERIWIDRTSLKTGHGYIYPMNPDNADWDAAPIAYLRKQSVIDRLKKKRDEWQRLADTAPIGQYTGERLPYLQMTSAARELIAEFEKE